MIESGQILQGRYRVHKQIGQGGMGAVFVATDERFGSTVAIKETFFTDEALRKAFEREARLLNSLKHAALPRVSDHFVEGNGQFIVMEFIEGEDLSEQLESDGKVFPVESILGWADQLLDALEYLHSQEMPVIHRDIKPQNLKLTPRGQIVLLDFGLAKGNPTKPDSATAAKSVFGYSRNYASIEQIQGSGTDPRSDLYSLSATLYHLLTGTPPEDALSRAMSVLSGKPDPLVNPTSIRTEIPAGVSQVLMRAMALAAEDRPSTAAELRLELRDAPNRTIPIVAPMTVDAPNATSIHAQKTQVQESDPRPQSAVKTITLSDQESKVTKLKPNTSTGGDAIAVAHAVVAQPAPRKPRRALYAAIVGAVLLVGSGVAFVSMGNRATVEPQNTAPTPDSRPAAVANKPIDATAGNPNSNVATQTPANGDAVTSAPAPTDVEPKRDTASKSDPTPTPESKKPTDDPQPKPTRETIIVTETPPPVRPDGRPPIDGDDRVPPPPTQPGGRRIPPEVWQKMTPKQRRQLRDALEMQRMREEQKRREQQQQQPRPPQK